MFQIKLLENKVVLTDLNNRSCATIYLDLGGSLQELTLEDTQIIKNLKSLHYNSSYSSAILFPFTNRIENGTYSFNNNEYNLELNENAENAIHGLVHDKKFKIINQETNVDFTSITLSYQEIQKQKGFPFNYDIILTYTLSQTELNLEVIIKNTDSKTFPFTLGWHPYFYSSDLFNSFLKFNSTKKVVLDTKMIPIKVDEISPIDKKFQIKNKIFDDCFIMNNKSVSFETPNYKINIDTSSHENYLQLYTPNKINAIAIEPMTGPANNFNNKLGLKTLTPNEMFKINWKIKLTNSKL